MSATDDGASPAQRYAASRRRAAHARSELARFEAGYPFPLDPFQVDACRALEAGRGVLVAAPTGSGKTLVGEFAVHLALAGGLKAFYTTPIKALSNQKYTDLVATYGSDRVGLLTGDTSINPGADIVVMTTEVLRNMLYSGSPRLERLGYVVMDEVHYLADRFRGPVWEEVIIHLPDPVRLVCLSATVSNAEELGEWLSQVRAASGGVELVVWEHRPVPLTQHMMVGRRLMDLYSLPVDVADADAEAAHLAAPPLNPDLVRAVERAERAAAATGSGERAMARSRRHGGPARRAGRRSALRGQHGRSGRTGLRPPSRLAVVQALAKADLLPAIVFVFSRAGCQAAVSQLLTGDVVLTSAEEAERIRRVIDARTAQIPSADLAALDFHTWSAGLERGFAAHHAGMLPVFKETVEELFSAGLVKVVYATETLALGINMPARTVVLESLRKWNGSAHVRLTPGEYTQLTGRAGRRGIDSQGHAVVLAAEGASPQVVSELASRRTYPLVSAFRPTYNMAVNLLSRSTRERTREVLESSFAQFQADRGAVELASDARRARARADRLADAVSCHLGDIHDYVLTRAELTRLEAEQARQRRSQRRAEARAQIDRLRRGDVVLFRQGRRRRHGVVLERARTREGEPSLLLLAEDGRVRTLTPSTQPEGVMAAGHMRLAAGVDVRRPRERQRVIDRLHDALREGSLAPIDPASQPGRLGSRAATGEPDPHAPAQGAPTLAAQIAGLRRRLAEHPCHGCPHREEHVHAARSWLRARSELTRTQERLARRTGTIARQFDAVCQVLLALGYLEPVDPGQPERELRVTDAGRLLARVYCERDLLIAQCLRTGAWEDLDEAELAGVVTACVYEPRAGATDLGLPVPPGSSLGRALRASLTQAHRIHVEETAAGVSTSGGLEPGASALMTQWAQGSGLAEVLEPTGMSAGDFVRLARQVLDVLGQLALVRGEEQVAQAAASAALEVGRGVVSMSGL